MEDQNQVRQQENPFMYGQDGSETAKLLREYVGHADETYSSDLIDALRYSLEHGLEESVEDRLAKITSHLRSDRPTVVIMHGSSYHRARHWVMRNMYDALYDHPIHYSMDFGNGESVTRTIQPDPDSLPKVIFFEEQHEFKREQFDRIMAIMAAGLDPMEAAKAGRSLREMHEQLRVDYKRRVFSVGPLPWIDTGRQGMGTAHEDPGRYYDISVGPVDKDPYFAYGGSAAGKMAAFQRDAGSVAKAINAQAMMLRKTIITAEEINAGFNRLSLPDPPKLVMSPANQPASKRGKRFQNPDYQSRQFKYSQKRKK